MSEPNWRDIADELAEALANLANHAPSHASPARLYHQADAALNHYEEARSE